MGEPFRSLHESAPSTFSPEHEIKKDPQKGVLMISMLRLVDEFRTLNWASIGRCLNQFVFNWEVKSCLVKN